MTNQIGGQLRESVILAPGPAILDRHVAALDIPGFVEALADRGHHGCVPLRRPAVEEPNHRHGRLLPACRKRPCCRAAEQRDEFAPLHYSITSSASASTLAGMSSPSALAVLR